MLFLGLQNLYDDTWIRIVGDVSLFFSYLVLILFFRCLGQSRLDVVSYLLIGAALTLIAAQTVQTSVITQIHIESLITFCIVLEILRSMRTYVKRSANRLSRMLYGAVILICCLTALRSIALFFDPALSHYHAAYGYFIASAFALTTAFLLLASLYLEAWQKIERQRVELELLNKHKDRLFSIVAHDLKNPFNVILGFSSLLTSKADTLSKEKILEYAAAINKASSDTYDTMSDLLDWSRLHMQEMSPTLTTQNLSQLVNEAIGPYHQMAEGKGIDLTLDIPATIHVSCDRTIISTVLRNLIGNAIKFTEKGGRVAISAMPNGRDLIVIQIHDNGIGMGEDLLRELKQNGLVQSTVGTAGEIGTGLGLSLVKGLLEQHGSALQIDSGAGVGTTVSFTLAVAGDTAG